MDRPVKLSSIIPERCPNAALGIKVREAQDPKTLAAELRAAIGAAAASNASYPMLQGLEIGASGGGANWRGMLTLTENQGWGFATSIPCALAKIECAAAAHSAELETVLGQMYARIQAEATQEPYIWQPRIAGSGRDGTYLVALAWSDGFPGKPTIAVQSSEQAGPTIGMVPILYLQLPQAPSGLVAAQQMWRIEWGVVLNDVHASGARGRLLVDFAPKVETQEIGSVNEWRSIGGVYMHTQSTSGPTHFHLSVGPVVGGHQVNWRGSYLIATQLNYNLAET